MPLNTLPAVVVKFIDANIDSVPALEALLLMRESENTYWSPEDVAARVYIEHTRARMVLDGLHRRRLLIVDGDPPRYRYSPEDQGLRDAVASVAATYRTHLVPITTLIHSNGTSAVRQFARAFDLKKDQ
jgi:hypothetical protein